jgi:hypothetical protein
MQMRHHGGPDRRRERKIREVEDLPDWCTNCFSANVEDDLEEICSSIAKILASIGQRFTLEPFRALNLLRQFANWIGRPAKASPYVTQTVTRTAAGFRYNAFRRPSGPPYRLLLADSPPLAPCSSGATRTAVSGSHVIQDRRCFTPASSPTSPCIRSLSRVFGGPRFQSGSLTKNAVQRCLTSRMNGHWLETTYRDASSSDATSGLSYA